VAVFLKLVIALAAAAFFFRQCRKPFSFIGRRVARAMNVGHRHLTAWGLSNVQIKPQFTILDVGCGGGRTIATLATMASRVSGVD
jgi:2-polyprenyl-3-methyl-5-hydroxy-6-metoxy-1,4-benzoquinol methylase